VFLDKLEQLEIIFPAEIISNNEISIIIIDIKFKPKLQPIRNKKTYGSKIAEDIFIFCIGSEFINFM
jgi:hypothetical protein